MSDDPAARIVPFGKHKGLTVAELLVRDPSYVQWLLGQGWLAQRFAELHAAIITRGANPDDSPEHNRIQARFLDPTFQVATLIAAIPEHLEQSKARAHGDITDQRDNHADRCRDQRDGILENIQRYKDSDTPWGKSYYADSIAKLPNAEARLKQALADLDIPLPKIKTKANFESGGADVRIQWNFAGNDFFSVYLTAAVEIKPALGDDFPSVMRQMSRLGAKILVIEQYNSDNLSLNTVREMFKANEQILLTIQDILAKIPDAKNSMEIIA